MTALSTDLSGGWERDPAGSAGSVGPGSDGAAAALAAAREHLLGLQDDEGWWQGELETNVTMDAEDLLMREFLGIRTPELTAEAARWIRSQQREDGSWATFYGGPGDVSTTTEAYIALRLAGDDTDAPHLARAAAFVRAAGGVESSRVFTRIWLALFGLWSWDDLPVIPPEIVLLPTGVPLALADWGCWARQTIVPLAIVAALRPSRPLPFAVPELHAGGPRRAGIGLPWTWNGVFQGLDRALHLYSRRPVQPLRALSMSRCVRWIVERQETDGSWGGIQPPWVYSIIALHLQGWSLDHPVIAAGLQGLERFTVHDERGRRIEACQSPVWDTSLAVVALADAGLPPDDPSLRSAGDWLLDEEVRISGDWAARRRRLVPGGWAFEFDNDGYPDTDDTAEVLLALRRVAGAPAAGAVRRGIDWLLGMQSRDGGWAAFDADQLRTLPTKLPFCDFGEVVDPPSADVTAHVVELLAHEGLAGAPATERGVRWLLQHQEPGGSWFGRWGVNHLYGTGAAVPALVAAGLPVDHPALRRAVEWVLSVQHADGGWGEDIRSYSDPAWIGRGDPTASQTGWALLALLAVLDGPPADIVAQAGTAASAFACGLTGAERARVTDAARRGVDWLVATQRADGSWDEPQFTGTGFPGDFSINYHLYRLVFPLTALGRWLTGPGAGDGPGIPQRTIQLPVQLIDLAQ